MMIEVMDLLDCQFAISALNAPYKSSYGVESMRNLVRDALDLHDAGGPEEVQAALWLRLFNKEGYAWDANTPQFIMDMRRWYVNYPALKDGACSWLLTQPPRLAR